MYKDLEWLPTEEQEAQNPVVTLFVLAFSIWCKDIVADLTTGVASAVKGSQMASSSSVLAYMPICG